jgi:hypothetical protein
MENQTTTNLNFEELLDSIEKLPTLQKAQVIEHLLGKNSSLSVVLGNNQLYGDIIMHINMMPKEQLGDILKAIAARFRNET